ncbi:MAG: PKD domain-containing protein [Flavisolibacter sp.]
MKKLVFATIVSFCCTVSFANHLKGGFFTYQYIDGAPAGSLRYHVTLTVYMACNATSQQINDPIHFTFFDAGSRGLVTNISVPIASQYNLGRTKDEECITGDQTGCYYHIVIYDLPSVDLPDNGSGYVVSYQRCCRIAGIQNMPSGSSNSIGNTYSIEIPGKNVMPGAEKDTSAQFQVNDTTVVCGGSYFKAPFLATDANGDSLSYYFCDAWTGGDNGNNSAPDIAVTPQSTNPVSYPVIPYATGFAGNIPLGSQVTIDPKTGIISGIAPSVPGEYVVTVCVNAYRHGILIARSRKELHLKVGDCNAIKATLNPQYITCDGFSLSFFNQTNNGIHTYEWEFGVPAQSDDTSNLSAPTYTFTDTGTYVIKLVVNRGEACSDSTTALAKVYPGFFPGFSFTGVCVNKPTQFFDTTRSKYGVVSAWNWDFGDVNSLTDISSAQNPTYTYSQTGIKNVRFIVSNSKGCVDTVFKDVTILDKPPLKVLPKDTLICNGDQVQLQAVGSGLFSWTPGSNIVNANSATPTVNPTTTTNYIVLLDDNGCLNRDTVSVRVVDFVTLKARPDTIICATDSVRLTAATDGLRFSWTPTATISNPTFLNPMALPVNNPTTYTIVATIGGCSATDKFTVALVPYPSANAGPDTIICYKTSAQLHASIAGNSFSWSPSSTLSDPSSLNPVASPPGTTRYVLSVRDVIGCPKPKTDTVLVTVLPKVNAFAGRDTAVVVGQPLQFNASGGINYSWSPGTSLNGIDIANPIGIYNGSFDSIQYRVVVKDIAGCTDSAFVNVKVFRTNPQIFVPTAFTPNGDGLNDYFKPVAVGISKFEYFRVYNRWGQMVFSTTSTEQGWDGKIGGQQQGSNTFVWVVRGVDYTGKLIFAKGTVTLIR